MAQVDFFVCFVCFFYGRSTEVGIVVLTSIVSSGPSGPGPAVLQHGRASGLHGEGHQHHHCHPFGTGLPRNNGIF